MATFYLEVTSGGDVLAVDADTILAYQTGSVEGGGTTLVTITPTLEAVGFALPSDIAVYYRSKLVDGSFGDWQTDNTFTLADGDYEVEAQLRYTSTGNPVVQKLDVDGVTLVDVTAVSTTFTVGGPTEDWDTYAGVLRYRLDSMGGGTSPTELTGNASDGNTISSLLRSDNATHDFASYASNSVLAIAVWDTVGLAWSCHEMTGVGTASGGRDAFGDATQPLNTGFGPAIYVPLTTFPGTDVSGWRDYDGPTS